MSPTAAHDSIGAPARLRASDAERFAVAEVLHDAVGKGLLTPAEGGERTAAAFAAVFRDDLNPLTQDLPPSPHDGRPPRPAGTSKPSGWRRQAQAIALKVWLVVVGMVSGWSPRRRIVVSVMLLAVLIGLLGFGFLEHDGSSGGFDGPGDHGLGQEAAEGVARG